jgi:hypothetical protein
MLPGCCPNMVRLSLVEMAINTPRCRRRTPGPRYTNLAVLPRIFGASMSLASSLCQAAILAALILAAAESVNGMPHTAAGRLHTLRPSASEAKQLSGRSPDPSDSAFQNSLHLSTALAGMIVLIVLEYSVNTVGYLLSRSWWRATDSILWILMGLISATWTAFIFLSAYIWEGNSDNPCSIDPSGAPCAARLAFAPWILNGVFLWWCVRLALHKIRLLICTYSSAMLRITPESVISRGHLAD